MKAKILIPILLLSLIVIPVSAKEMQIKPIKDSQGLIEKAPSMKDKLQLNGNQLGDIKDKIQEQKEDRAEEREARRERICQNMEERINAKVDRFQNGKADHVAKYAKLEVRLEDIVAKLSAKGFDTSKLEEDIATLSSMAEEYAVAYSEFVASLEESRGYACGNADADFKDALTSAREEHTEAKVLRASISEFYTNVIREDIKDLREQAAEMVENLDSAN